MYNATDARMIIFYSAELCFLCLIAYCLAGNRQLIFQNVIFASRGDYYDKIYTKHMR